MKWHPPTAALCGAPAVERQERNIPGKSKKRAHVVRAIKTPDAVRIIFPSTSTTSGWDVYASRSFSLENAILLMCSITCLVGGIQKSLDYTKV